jgi:hypothetical protein
MIGEIALPLFGSHGIVPTVAGTSDGGFSALAGFLHAVRKAASLE